MTEDELIREIQLKRQLSELDGKPAPGYEYKIVKAMVTNFHQPQSTLLLLVSAFVHGDWQKISMKF